MLSYPCRFLIAAGDPLQLPPVVASPAHVTAAPSGPGRVPPALPGQGQQGQLHGLLRPLFLRLAALGLPPFLLRRQYRCADIDGRGMDKAKWVQRCCCSGLWVAF